MNIATTSLKVNVSSSKSQSSINDKANIADIKPLINPSSQM